MLQRRSVLTALVGGFAAAALVPLAGVSSAAAAGITEGPPLSVDVPQEMQRFRFRRRRRVFIVRRRRVIVVRRRFRRW